MASWLECAAFSLYVYRDQDQPPLPNGWSVLLDCPDELQSEDYYGMAFINTIQTDGEISYDVVIAHRGTIANPFSYWNDFCLALQQVPTQFNKGAYLFDEYVRQYMGKNYPIPLPQINYTITHTGHSLGAAIAELCVASSVRFMDTVGPALGITFESPGSKPIISNMESSGDLPIGALSCAQNFVTTALADVDVVNSCNEQVTLQSYSVDITQVGYDYGADSVDAGILPPGITLYIANYSFSDQHKMLKMYQYWLESEEYTFVKKESAQDIPWPVGLENGYMCYTNYSLRKNYWDGYIQYIWNNHPEIHQEYNNDLNQWSQVFQSYLITGPKKALNFAFFKENADERSLVERVELSSKKNTPSWCTIS